MQNIFVNICKVILLPIVVTSIFIGFIIGAIQSSEYVGNYVASEQKIPITIAIPVIIAANVALCYVLTPMAVVAALWTN